MNIFGNNKPEQQLQPRQIRWLYSELTRCSPNDSNNHKELNKEYYNAKH